MRSLFALILFASLDASTPYILERRDFGTSALAPEGDLSPEYAGSNDYASGINAAVANQI